MSRSDLTCGEVDQFLTQCERELKVYPRSPIAVTKQTAKDIDMSGIFRMTPEQIDEALKQLEAA
jgi:hypothetical protein